jgi:penicillin-binding protein 2
MYETRLRAVLLVLGLGLAILAAGLFQLQVVDGDRYRAEAAHRLTSAPGYYPTMRGSVFDRHGVVLAQDAGAFDVAIYYPFIELDDVFVAEMARKWGVAPQEVHARMARMWPALSRLTGVPEEELYRRAETIMARVKAIEESVAAFNGRPMRVREATYGEKTSVPHPLVYDIDLQAVGAISSRPEDFPGLTIRPTSKREYAQGAVAPHVLGRLGEVTREDLADGGVNDNLPPGDLKRYLPGDWTGRGGVEGACEDILRGSRGVYLKGVEGDFLEDIQPVPGQDVHLTLDIALQADVEALLDHPPAGVGQAHVRGAAVIIDCRTGEVLTLASAPRFDARTFQADFNRLKDDEDSPLFNRAVHGQYPMGSIFKPITALAAMHEVPTFTPQTTFNCQGVLDPRHPNRFRCDVFVARGQAHGPLQFREAMKQSCNIYFYHVAEMLGLVPGGGNSPALAVSRLQNWAQRFGLGQRTGIGLGGEPNGSVSATDPLNLSIGQGALQVTPLQVAQLYGLIATNGRMPPLRLIRERPASEPRPDLGLNPGYMSVLKDSLTAVVNEEHGTAYSTVYLRDIRIAGKTGTAQSGRPDEPHAWFAGYAPADNPRIAFAIIVEYGGHGGTAAGPIARELVRKCQYHGYFSDTTRGAPGVGPSPKTLTPPTKADPPKIVG